MQQNYAEIQAAGAELIAISSDNVGDTQRTVQNGGLKFPVLADEERETIAAYNVVDPSNKRIARPATYLLGQNGIVAWKSLNTVGARVPTAQILTELGKR